MCEKYILDLQLFGEGGEGGAAGDAGQGGGSAAEINIGDVLEDGTIVDENLASSMRENADLYGNLTRNQQAHAQAPEQGQGKPVSSRPGKERKTNRRGRNGKKPRNGLKSILAKTFTRPLTNVSRTRPTPQSSLNASRKFWTWL